MKRLITLVVICGLMAFAIKANALTISLTYGDNNYVGLINDDIPSNPANETSYLNNLITLAPGAGLQTIGTESYSRVGSSLTSLLTVPSGVWQSPDNDPNSGDLFTATTSGTIYILGKYDAFHAGAWVWMINVNAGDIIDLPDTFGQYGLSHSTVWYNPSAPVPEPATMLLLGSGIVGLVGFRKKFKA